MADETPNSMNLDLNLGPVEHPLEEGERQSTNLANWLDGPIREAIGQRTRSRQRYRSVWRPISIPIEGREIALELIGGNGMEMGEGSVAAEERRSELTKICDNNNGFLDDEILKNNDDIEKGNSDGGSFFDCNICLDLASDPVVTCCGHLFCWPCLYRWLHIHSNAKECPICKGEVNTKSVTPIYGRGNKTRELEEDSSLKIPHRPIARRVESWRQTIQRNAFGIPMEEMIRRLGNRFDLSRDLVHPHPLPPDSPQELQELLLHRYLSNRAIRREQNNTPVPVQSDNNVIDLTQSSPTNSEQVERESLRLSSLLSRRSSRAAAISSLTSALSSTERLVESYFRTQSEERRQEQPPGVDDRDSVSSIAAVIQSESQTLDNAVEIESTVSLSTSSSRRRREPSRTSDVDSGDSLRPPARRRRLP